MRDLFRTSLFACLLVAAAPAARADQIDRALVKDSAAVAKAVRGLGAKSVAVLKFQVQVGTERPTFHGGTLGGDMAHRVENLILLTADPEDPKPELRTGAGDAAAKAARESQSAFDWTTPEGREKLLKLELPLAWDETKRSTPDAFITGTVRVSADMKEAFVDLVGFTKDDPAKLRPLATVGGGTVDGKPRGVRMDRAILTALGRSFAVPRELTPNSKTSQFFAAEYAAIEDARRNTGKPGGPVKLELYYDDAPAVPEADPNFPGEFRVPPPAPGQKVKFLMTNTGPDRVAVLLTVNGLNTVAVDGEDLAAPGSVREKFRPWVLEPDPTKKYAVPGFLQNVETGEFRPFVALSKEASEQAYDTLSPAYAGKVHLIVYGPRPKQPATPVPAATVPSVGTKPEKPPVDPPAPVDPPEPPKPGPKVLDAATDDLKELNEGVDAGGLLAVEAGLGKARSLAAAQDAVRKRTRIGRNADGDLVIPKKSRSLLGKGGNTLTAGPVETVEFEYDALPLASVVINYDKRPGR